MTSTSLGEVGKGAESWVLKLSVGHFSLFLPYLIMINKRALYINLFLSTTLIINSVSVSIKILDWLLDDHGTGARSLTLASVRRSTFEH